MKFKFLILMFICLFLVSTVSAWDWDNRLDNIELQRDTPIAIGNVTITYQELWERYSPIRIKNALGLGETLFEGAITKHTETCDNDCESTIDISLTNDGALIDDVSFETLQDDGSWKLQDVRSYQFYIKTGEQEVNDYGLICVRGRFNSTSGMDDKVCSRGITGSHMEDKWTPYHLGEIKRAGNYKLKLEADKKASRTVDWKIKTQGKWIESWAVWGSSLNDDLQLFYKFNSTSGTAIESVNGIFNGTLNGNVVQGSPGINDDSFEYPNDGAGSYVSTGYTINNAGNISISGHFNTGNIGDFQGIMQKGDSSDGWFFTLQTSQLTWTIVGGSATLKTQVLSPNKWYSFVGTLNEATGLQQLYLNGVLVNSSTGSGTLGTNSEDLEFGTLGANKATQEFDGNIDEVGIWDKILTADEALDLSLNITYDPDPAISAVNLNSPLDNQVSSISVVEVNCSVINIVSNITNISLYSNQSGTFELVNTTTGLSGQFNETTWSHNFGPEGKYLWTCESCDEDNDCVFATQNRTVIIDTTFPILSVTSPRDSQGIFVLGNNLSLNWTVSDENLNSCWFEYNNINTTVTCSENTTEFTPVLNVQNLTLYANDSGGNTISNFTSWTYDFVQNSINFNTTTIESSFESFILNMTTNINVLSIDSNFIYNGTIFPSTASCSGTECIVQTSIDIPLIVAPSPQENIFNFNLTIFDGFNSTNILTDENTQNVSDLIMGQCNASITTKTLNFTSQDEQNLERIIPFSFDGTFEFWLGSGSVKDNFSLSLNQTEINICMGSANNITIDAQINYDEGQNESLYTSRFYYFDSKVVNSVLENIPLFLLKSASSTSFILKVQDQNLLPVSSAFIETQRYYPGTDTFEIVQIARTDDEGKSVGFFQTETVDYKFIIKKNQEELLETSKGKVVPETSPFTLTFNTGENLGSPWVGQEGIINLTSALTFNESSNIVRYTYVDISSTFTQGRLLVIKNSPTNSTANIIICNDTSSLSSATITCTVGNNTGFYTASGYITRSGEGLDKQTSFQIEDVSSVVGLLGLFFGWFLILVASFIFKFNEIAGIWGVTITVFLINITGLIKFGTVFVTSTIVVAIILTWLLER